ncbi:MAG: tail fiber protein [Chloroflexota bacterium]|jgi:microcystin-dependent protein
MEFYMGQIILVPFTSVPTGTYPCDDRSLLISTHDALFSLQGALSDAHTIHTARDMDMLWAPQATPLP